MMGNIFVVFYCCMLPEILGANIHHEYQFFYQFFSKYLAKIFFRQNVVKRFRRNIRPKYSRLFSAVNIRAKYSGEIFVIHKYVLDTFLSKYSQSIELLGSDCNSSGDATD